MIHWWRLPRNPLVLVFFYHYTDAEFVHSDQQLTGSRSSEGELHALLAARDAEIERLRRENVALAHERDDFKRDLDAARNSATTIGLYVVSPCIGMCC